MISTLFWLRSGLYIIDGDSWREKPNWFANKLLVFCEDMYAVCRNLEDKIMDIRNILSCSTANNALNEVEELVKYINSTMPELDILAMQQKELHEAIMERRSI